MNYDISDKILKETQNCNKDIACLNSSEYALCEVVECVGDQVHFIKCLDKKYCSYKMLFGYSSYFCNCPIRKEIFNKYGI